MFLRCCRQQDEHLEDIEAAVSRLGRVGLTIHEELTTQVRTSRPAGSNKQAMAWAADEARAAHATGTQQVLHKTTA
jgi:4-hydroxyphenylpyruvate dioxygenase-like putative hemolysin